jgi:hypothetical protein
MSEVLFKTTDCTEYKAGTFTCSPAPTSATIIASIPSDARQLINRTRQALYKFMNGESRDINPTDANGVPYGLVSVDADDVGTWATINDFYFQNGKIIPSQGDDFTAVKATKNNEERWVKVFSSLNSCEWKKNIQCFTHMPFTVGVATAGPLTYPTEGTFFEYGKLGDMILSSEIETYPSNGDMLHRKILMVNPANKDVCKPAVRFRHVATIKPEKPTANDSLDCGKSETQGHVKILVPECDDENYVGVGLVFSNKNMWKFPIFDYVVKKPDGNLGVRMYPNIEDGKVVFVDGIYRGVEKFQGKPSCAVSNKPDNSRAFLHCWQNATKPPDVSKAFGTFCPKGGDNDTNRRCFSTTEVNGTYYCINKKYLINRDVSAECLLRNESKFFSTTPDTEDKVKSIFATVSPGFHLFTCFRRVEAGDKTTIGDTDLSTTYIPFAPKLRFFIPSSFLPAKCCFSGDTTSTSGYPGGTYEDFICCALNGGVKTQSQLRQACGDKLMEYCNGENLKKRECQVFCSKKEFNCDANLEKYCKNNPTSIADDGTPICTCFDKVAFANYVNGLTLFDPDFMALYGLVFRKPECSFPPCYDSKYSHKTVNVTDTCPNMAVCMNKLSVKNDGTIIGDVNISQLNNCMASTTYVDGKDEETDPSCEITGYSECSKACGGGIQYPLFSGQNCTGAFRPCNTQECKSSDCDISWNTDWTSCNVECGRGVKTRKGVVMKLEQDGGQKCSDICNNMYDRPTCIAMTGCEGTNCSPVPPAADLTTGEKVAGGIGILFVVILIIQFVIPMVIGYFAGKSQNSSEKPK